MRVSIKIAILSLPLWSFFAGAQINPRLGLNDTFAKIGNPSLSVRLLVIDPLNAKVIYAVTEEAGIFKSTNGGEIWIPSNNGISPKNKYKDITTLAIDPSDSATLYAGTWNNVYKSIDAGEHWVIYKPDTGIVFRLVIANSTPPAIYSSTDRGLFKNETSGSEWKKVGAKENSTIWPLAVDPLDATTIYGSFEQSEDVRIIPYEGWPKGFYRSRNRGENWEKISGLVVVKLVIDRRNPGTMYAGTNHEGILKSMDGGMTWSAINSGIIKAPITSLAIDPQNPENLYATTSYAGASHMPLYNFDSSRVYKSMNGGQSWEKISDFPANHVVIDPVISDIVYAATPRYGVFKSTNAGRNWQPFNSGLIRNER
jgi:hypothetical protein